MQTLAAEERLMVALDMDASEAIALAHELTGVVRWLKIGMTLFYQEGPEIVARIRELGFHVFLDLKLHDIPTTVKRAMKSLSLRLLLSLNATPLRMRSPAWCP